MKNKGVQIVILVVAFLAVAGGSFWLGGYYQTQSRTNRMRQFSNMTPEQIQQRLGNTQRNSGANSGARPQGLGQGPGMTTGKVDKVTSDNLTITTRFGSQKVSLTSKTTISKAAKGDLDDIKPGTQILVNGEGTPGEKIEAKSIQILSPSK